MYQFGVKYRGYIRRYADLTRDEVKEMVAIVRGYDEPVAIWVVWPNGDIHVRVRP